MRIPATVRAAGATLKSPLQQQPLAGRQFEHGEAKIAHECISDQLLLLVAGAATVIEHDQPARADMVDIGADSKARLHPLEQFGPWAWSRWPSPSLPVGSNRS